MLRRQGHGGTRGATAGCVFALAIAAVIPALAPATASARGANSSAAVAVTVGVSGVSPAVAPGFVGLATEFWDIEKDVGTNPAEPDVPFEQIAHNLAPHGGFVLRIGGDSTDWTWWPIPGMKQPPWVRWTMTPVWAAVTKRLADDLRAHLIVGINMEADSTAIASTEVRELASHLAGLTTTYELGNEPELYSKFAFYKNSSNRPVLGRPDGYSLSDISTQWNQIANALPQARLAGPGYSSLNALPGVGQFLDGTKRLSLLTVHSYALRSTRCGGKPQESHLFAPVALQGLASQVTSWAGVAREHSIPLRVDEMNSVTCGGQNGLTNTFGPALWALNILPLYAEAGAAGVNFQTRAYTAQNLIQPRVTNSGWRVQVQPEYYGLLAFAKLTPPGSHLLQISAMPAGLYAWAVSRPGGSESVVVTNVNDQATTVEIRAAGGHGPATVEALRSASGHLTATGGITLGGQSISTSTGQLSGTPATTTVHSSGGAYYVTVSAASASIVSFAR
jgi:hypothetical protein